MDRSCGTENDNGVATRRILDYLYFENIGATYQTTGKLLVQTCVEKAEIEQDILGIHQNVNEFERTF